MALASITLDPDAQAYTDDEIVGKVNAAAANITRADSVEVAAILESATEKLMSDVEKTKLAGIEDGAKDDQSGAEIKAAYEAEANAYTDTKDTKLSGIAEGAEVNPADLDEVPDSATRKAMSDTEKTKLTGIEDSAKDDQTGAEVRDLIIALGDTERKIVITNPLTGEYKVVAVQVDASLELDVDYDDVPES